MGLDITAYKNVKFDLPAENEDDDVITFSDYAESFQLQLGSLAGHTVRRYTSECEEYEDYEDSYSFRAGSYGGYNTFRHWICQRANGVTAESVWASIDGGYSSEANFVFGYLINFSDCDGYICKEIAEILYHEFVNNKDKVLGNTPEGAYYHELYLDWLNAFDYARHNGYVAFH